MKELNDLIENIEKYKEIEYVPRQQLLKELKQIKVNLEEQLRIYVVGQSLTEKVCNHEWTHNSRTGEKYCRFKNCGEISE